MSTTARRLRRRDAIALFGGLGLAAATGSRALGGVLEAPAAGAATCVLSPEVTEGPYWIDNKLTRRDITEDRPGVPLALRLTVVDATTCDAIPHADVEVWHADAQGAYSGYSTGNTAKRFLRGHQKAGADGRVRFDTIYPGWYRGRTPHIHLKVHVGGHVVHTGQLFFGDATSRAVYRTSSYKSHGQADTTNGEDDIYDQAGGSKALAKVTKRAHDRGYLAAMTLGVNR
jgi:protocatechuate 3,4-dioxygenase beta subunit